MITLEAIKSADKDFIFAIASNKLKYSIIISNTGDTAVSFVRIQDIISPGAVFVPGSVTINGCRCTHLNPNDVISLGSINPGENIIITFEVKVNCRLKPSELRNVARIFYRDVFGNTFFINTNEVVTPVIFLNVCVLKNADEKKVMCGDTINYSVIINNFSNIDINNVIFNDELDSSLTLVPNSVRVNLTPLDIDSFEGGVPIGTIMAGANVIITFSVVVSCEDSPMVINNEAMVNYEYTIVNNSTSFTSTGQSTSNVVMTRVLLDNCNFNCNCNRNCFRF